MKKVTFIMTAALFVLTASAQPTAKEWNKEVVGWNLGNQLECSAPGQDGESMQIGMPDNSINAETAWDFLSQFSRNEDGSITIAE